MQKLKINLNAQVTTNIIMNRRINMALKFDPLNKIFDKMGFLCRTIGKFCSGKEYENLNPKEKQIIDIDKSNGQYGKYFSYLSEDVINYFLCRVGKEKINDLVYDIYSSILRCVYKEEVKNSAHHSNFPSLINVEILEIS